MGMCQPSGGINPPVIGRIGSLKTEGMPPNSRTDLFDLHGNLIQSRWYGPDGRAIRNRDFNHGDGSGELKFPHDHKWDWSKNPPRQNHEDPNYENFSTGC